MPVKIGDAFVRVRPDTAGFAQETDSRLKPIFGRVAAAAAGAFAAVKTSGYLKGAVAEASDLAESVNVVQLTFKDAAPSLEAFFKTSATSVGLAESAARQAASNIGGLLNNLGYTREESARTSESVLRLGADLGSAFNKDPAQAVEAIGAALRGESEPIRAFNVSINDTTLKAKALEMGLYSGKGALDQNAKAQATLALIMQQTADVQGDFANTSDGLANKQRIAAARSENLKRVIGEGLLPVQLALTTVWADRLLPALTTFAEQRGPQAAAAAERIGAGFTGLYDLLVRGDFTGQFRQAFDVEEDSRAVDVLFRIREGLIGTYALVKDGDFTGEFRRAFGVEEDSKVVDVLFRIREAVTNVDDVLAEVDWAAVWQGIRDFVGDGDAAGSALSSMATSAGELAPLVGDLRQQVPSLSDALSVGAEVMGFLAEHTDTLAKFLPVLAAGFVLAKTAQLAANAAAAVSPALRIAEVIANRQLAASQTQLTAAIAAQTAATGASTGVQVANTAATNAGATSKVRAAAAWVAARVAMVASTVATGVMTAAQWALNAALNANPIGLVILAVAALVAGIVIAYRESETFRSIVQAAWQGIQDAAKWAWENVLKPTVEALVQAVVGAYRTFQDFRRTADEAWEGIKSKAAEGVRAVVDFFLGMAEGILGAAESAFGWVPGLGEKLRSAQEAFATFRDNVNTALGGISDKSVSIDIGLTQRSVKLATFQPQALAAGGRVQNLSGKGRQAYDTEPAMLRVDEHVWTPEEVDAAGGHAAMYRMRKAALSGALRGYATGGRVGLTVQPRIPGTDALAGDVAALDRAMAAAAVRIGEGIAAKLVPAAGQGWQWQMATLRSRFPGLPLNSGYRPGSITATGNPSWHGRGRAVDVPPRMDVFDWIAATYGSRTKELIFSPAGGRQLHNGRPHFYTGVTRDMHFDHVHWAFDRGGIARGTGLMPKRTLRPERVLSPESTRSFDRLVELLEESAVRGRGRGGREEPVAARLIVDGREFARAQAQNERRYG